MLAEFFDQDEIPCKRMCNCMPASHCDWCTFGEPVLLKQSKRAGRSDMVLQGTNRLVSHRPQHLSPDIFSFQYICLALASSGLGTRQTRQPVLEMPYYQRSGS